MKEMDMIPEVVDRNLYNGRHLFRLNKIKKKKEKEERVAQPRNNLSTVLWRPPTNRVATTSSMTSMH